MWSVWQVYYTTYAEVAATGLPQEKCFPPKLVAAPLKFEEAMKMAASLGFDHCVKPYSTN